LDLIGDKWTLVLVRHLLVRPRGFQELRVRTGIAPRVLSTRLRQLTSAGFVEPVSGPGARSTYGVTDRGRSLEPLIADIARWYVHHALTDLDLDIEAFTETSPVSILESLPFLLREDRALGVWTIRIDDGQCSVSPGFAAGAHVRYTADARVWCGVALGFTDPREAIRDGLLFKEGGRAAMDHYFHQIARVSRASAASESPQTGERGESPERRAT
jgi:DNA-binding HxlR family transcriptional regulator